MIGQHRPCRESKFNTRPLVPNMAGPVVGAATNPQISWRSFSSTQVETYSMCQTRAPVGNPGLEVLAGVRSSAATRSPGPRPAGTFPPTPFGPAHGPVSAGCVEAVADPEESGDA
jgi:hypothetical protein